MFTGAALGLVPVPVPPIEGGRHVIVCADLTSTYINFIYHTAEAQSLQGSRQVVGLSRVG